MRDKREEANKGKEKLNKGWSPSFYMHIYYGATKNADTKAKPKEQKDNGLKQPNTQPF
jgi:hypothetical protein